ncbi:carbohydrate binding domain-containing protein [Flaviramulus sp. BrNp1-15]|uniref:carbohydrate binding domain-containing protein n=1 Tax=Flaviramulus sp. BrNp1-15 TaxID=2916754 RepID=UPI001EE8CB6F|nr:carbohydrate binding domain-containing protein [Flaviramulus sp. BrNp1-15]ULC60701.1 carbohydrate binding domain-containing protein [Flaviramulus sp. BrNp1-15]
MLKNLKFISKFFTIIAIVFAVSCEDDDSFAPVVIDSVESDNFYPGDDVTFKGSNFNKVLFVFLEKNQIPFQLDGDTITFTLPESATIGSGVITLVMANGYTVTKNITVIARPFPIILTISPSAAQEGEQVTITGTSLDNLQSVTIGEVEAAVVSSTASELIITVPAGLAEGVATEVKVVTNGGEASPSSSFYVGQNLLLNGELELGDGDDFTNWGKWNGGDGLTATTADGNAYAGRSLRAVAVGGDAWRTQFVSDPATTLVGAEYKVFMLIKGQPGTPGVGGNVRFSTNPDALYSGNYDITAEWQQIEWTFVANAEQTRAVLDLGVIADAVYFVDNITLIQTGTPPPPPINTNGSFEDSDLGVADGVTGWGGLNGANASGEITDEDSHDGDKSVKMTINAIGANPWDIQPNSSMTVVDGETYHLSVWFKGQGITNIKVAIDQGGDPGWAEWGNPEQAFQDNTWTEVSYDFTADTTNSADGNARFAISMSYDGNVGGVLYIDDLEVRIVQ